MASPTTQELTRRDVEQALRRAIQRSNAYARSLGTTVKDARGEAAKLILAHWNEVSRQAREMNEAWYDAHPEEGIRRVLATLVGTVYGEYHPLIDAWWWMCEYERPFKGKVLHHQMDVTWEHKTGMWKIRQLDDPWAVGEKKGE
jgi:hypothetical protein